MIFSVTDPIEFFTGAWAYERRIEDRLAGQTGQAEGMAIFEPEGDGLVWVETGMLTIGGRSFEASRRMSIAPEGDRWLVRFEDGKPFHYLDLISGRDEAKHLCVADLYTGDLRVEEGETRTFRTHWEVVGPAKDQTIVTGYRSLGEDPGLP